jgi:hypothetical protein
LTHRSGEWLGAKADSQDGVPIVDCNGKIDEWLVIHFGECYVHGEDNAPGFALMPDADWPGICVIRVILETEEI